MGLRRVHPSIWAKATAYIRGRGKLLPDSFVDEIGTERSFTAHLCTPQCLREACDLTRDSYGAAYVSHDIAEQWRLRNPCAFVQIMNPENRLCACFGVLPLRQSFVDQLIAGIVCDQDLRGENVCSRAESVMCSQLYVSGVVVLEPGSHKGHKRAAVMCWVMLEYIRRLYDLKVPRQLYAVAVTRESRQLMKNLGFVLEMSAAYRKDKCDLYRYDLTEASWNVLLCELNDWSRICAIDLILPNDCEAVGVARPSSSTPDAEQISVKKRILFVAGDRGGHPRNQAQTPREFTAIKETLRDSENRYAFELAQPILGASRDWFVEAYRQHPMILHFAGHGDDRSLSLVLDQGAVVSSTQLLAEQLSTILKNFPKRVSLCVLNTCESSAIAQSLTDADAVDAAVGWRDKVTDDAAIAFSGTLYGSLSDGLALEKSVTLAWQSSGSKDAPTLCTAKGIDRDLRYVDGKEGK